MFRKSIFKWKFKKLPLFFLSKEFKKKGFFIILEHVKTFLLKFYK
ncbi:hypothetical protein LEP1GSC166_2480 [Leptospira kirschneri]|nr:hypothetical protein LEP1GSC166_2480 [Leptospira kirschneri]